MNAPPPRVALSSDHSRVMFRRGEWRGDFPVADLARWLRFYRGLRDRSGGRYRSAYQPVVAALEGVERKLTGDAR